uniref:Uncharacterized protein n=1 Tax=Rhizophora mucronata TaxID=61149 RepID=A0A2P2QE94_RHIMU
MCFIFFISTSSILEIKSKREREGNHYKSKGFKI